MSTDQAILKNITTGKTQSFGFKQGALLVGQLFIAFVVMLIAFVISGAFIDTGIRLSPEEASQSGPAVLIVSLINSLVLGYLILRSRWYGVKLITAVVVIHFGVQTFMSQIETLFFINALKMPLDLVLRIIATGFLRALIFAPPAVFVLGKFKGTTSAESQPRLAFSPSEWVKRFAILAIVYVIVYFGFGYFVAFRWVEAREYYAGTFTNDITLPLFQVLRGAMWAALALPIVKMMNVKVWESCFAIALAFAVLLTSGLIFPNPYMPAMVRQAHFFEVSSSMLTFGAIAGWVWTRRASAKGG